MNLDNSLSWILTKSVFSSVHETCLNELKGQKKKNISKNKKAVVAQIGTENYFEAVKVFRGDCVLQPESWAILHFQSIVNTTGMTLNKSTIDPPWAYESWHATAFQKQW